MQILHDVKEKSHTRSYRDSSDAYRLVDKATVTAHAQPVILGQAIRDVRGDLTQAQLADAVNTDQGTVSRWENGNLRPELDDLRAIEDAAGVPHGTILRRAGYVAEIKTVRDALEADRTIPRAAIPYLLDAVEAARKGAAR